MDDAGRLQLVELCFCLAQLVRVQVAGLGKHRVARRLDGVVDFVLRKRFSFPSPTMVGNEASRDRTDGAMEQRAAANLEHSVQAAEDGLESPAPGGRLGRLAARGRTRSLNLGWVCIRQRAKK